MPLLKSIADKISACGGTADIGPLMSLGMAEVFRQCVAAMAVLSYVLADSE